ncbi:FtsW/RodA/SpoVE family cell cycle protein, partial [bacterium]|nr:FtsW/RodA/SpoVE family cell cycle protein [bacterium]
MVGRRKKNRFLHWFLQPFMHTGRGEHRPDFVLLGTVGFLLFFGLLFLSSASSTLGFYKHGDTYFFVKQQLSHGLLLGLLFFYIVFRIDYNFYRKVSILALFASFILLILVFITSLKGDYGTAQSWIVLGGISFQPSELVKLLLIIFLAGWFERKGRGIKELSTTTIPFIIILGIISFLIIKQPDFGTLSIIVLTSIAIYYVAGARLSHIAYIFSGAVLGFIALVKAAPYRMNRFIAWFNPDVDPQGIGWQI